MRRDKTPQKYEMQSRIYVWLFSFEYFILALKHKANQKKGERKKNHFFGQLQPLYLPFPGSFSVQMDPSALEPWEERNVLPKLTL